jgi:GntR family transcriptional repressor for pyruvate dehydrogenase complex
MAAANGDEAVAGRALRRGPRGELVPPVRRVRKAYEQVADQLRELILSGQLARGERLPTEAALAGEFGVSRATVREALRLLAAQELLRTAKGVSGGSYVTTPTVDHVSDFVHSSIALLSASRDVSLHELLEIRELLEIPAARLAAQRRGQDDLECMRAAIPGQPLRLGTQEQFAYNREFHSLLIKSCGNSLLSMATEPIFRVLQTNLARSALGRSFHSAINEHHLAIAAAVDAGSARLAEREMRAHLTFLRPFYEKAWRHAVGIGDRN